MGGGDFFFVSWLYLLTDKTIKPHSDDAVQNFQLPILEPHD